jgi:hypothetical protein
MRAKEQASAIIGAGLGPVPAPSKQRVTATYQYTDETGNVLSEVLRYEPKDFRQRKPRPNGGWTWTTVGTRTVPFQLPRVLQADRFLWSVEDTLAMSFA